MSAIFTRDESVSFKFREMILQAHKDAWALIRDQAMQDEILLDKPHFLYVTEQQTVLYELATEENETYKTIINRPISDLLARNMSKIFNPCPDACDFIDLGPGFPDKSLQIVDYLLKNKCEIRYCPVDVSPHFLAAAVNAMDAKGVTSFPLLANFEAAFSNLDFVDKNNRVVFLGFTFNNFDPNDIVNILASITRTGDTCIICVQPSTNLSDETLLIPYQGDRIEAFTFEPLRALGFARDWFRFESIFSEWCIKTTFVLARAVKLKGVCFGEGQRFVTAKSYRLPIDSIISAITKKLKIRNQYQDPKTHVTVVHLTGNESS